MKALRIALVVILSAVLAPNLWAGPADDLLEKGDQEFSVSRFDKAAEIYEKILKDYPSFTLRDSVQLQLGRAYLFDGDYTKSIAAFKPLFETGRSKQMAEQAQYYLPLAQFFAASQPDLKEGASHKLFKDAAEGFSKYLKGSGDYKQEALFYRGLAYYSMGAWAKAQADLQKMVNDYRDSPSHAEYIYRLGLAYSGQAQELMGSDDTLKQSLPVVKKAVEIYEQITPEKSEVVSNQAQFSKANLLFTHANRTNDKEALPTVLEEYRKIRSRDEMVPVVQKAIDGLEQENRRAALSNNKAAQEEIQERRSRLLSRLDALKNGPDPALRAFNQMGQSYRQMGQFDEARMLFRRIEPFAEGDLKKNVMIQTILSLALQGKVKEADAGLRDFLKKYPGDKAAESISFLIGRALMDDNKFEEAIKQFNQSLKDYPKGTYAIQAALDKSAALVALGKGDQAAQVLENLSKENQGTAIGARADFTIGMAHVDKQDFVKAAEAFQRVLDNNKGETFHESAGERLGFSYLSAGKYEEAIAALQDFLKKFPKAQVAPNAMYYIALSQHRSKKEDDAIATVKQLATDYPDSQIAPFALDYLAATIYGMKQPEKMKESYEIIFAKFPEATQAIKGRRVLADYYKKKRNYEEAKKQYEAITKLNNPDQSAYARTMLGDMMYRAAQEMGNYPRFTDEQKKQFDDYLKQSETSFQDVGIQHPESKQLSSAISGLYQVAKLRRKFDLVDDAGLQRYFDEMAALMKDPNAKAQVELAKAAWPYEQGDYPDALIMYEEVIKNNPGVSLGNEDTRRYGDLLLKNNKPDEAIAVFQSLEERSDPRDVRALAEVYYGLGSAYFDKKDYAKAKENLEKFTTKDYGWYPNRGLAMIMLGQIAAAEGDSTKAKKILGETARSQTNSGEVKARALIALGDILAKENMMVPDPKDPSKLNAAACYERAEVIIGLSDPPLGLKALEKAKKMYEEASRAKALERVNQKIQTEYKDVEPEK